MPARDVCVCVVLVRSRVVRDYCTRDLPKPTHGCVFVGYAHLLSIEVRRCQEDNLVEYRAGEFAVALSVLASRRHDPSSLSHVAPT